MKSLCGTSMLGRTMVQRKKEADYKIKGLWTLSSILLLMSKVTVSKSLNFVELRLSRTLNASKLL